MNVEQLDKSYLNTYNNSIVKFFDDRVLVKPNYDNSVQSGLKIECIRFDKTVNYHYQINIELFMCNAYFVVEVDNKEETRQRLDNGLNDFYLYNKSINNKNIIIVLDDININSYINLYSISIQPIIEKVIKPSFPSTPPPKKVIVKPQIPDEIYEATLEDVPVIDNKITNNITMYKITNNILTYDELHYDTINERLIKINSNNNIHTEASKIMNNTSKRSKYKFKFIHSKKQSNNYNYFIDHHCVINDGNKVDYSTSLKYKHYFKPSNKNIIHDHIEALYHCNRISKNNNIFLISEKSAIPLNHFSYELFNQLKNIDFDIICLSHNKNIHNVQSVNKQTTYYSYAYIIKREFINTMINLLTIREKEYNINNYHRNMFDTLIKDNINKYKFLMMQNLFTDNNNKLSLIIYDNSNNTQQFIDNIEGNVELIIISNKSYKSKNPYVIIPIEYKDYLLSYHQGLQYARGKYVSFVYSSWTLPTNYCNIDHDVIYYNYCSDSNNITYNPLFSDNNYYQVFTVINDKKLFSNIEIVYEDKINNDWKLLKLKNNIMKLTDKIIREDIVKCTDIIKITTELNYIDEIEDTIITNPVNEFIFPFDGIVDNQDQLTQAVSKIIKDQQKDYAYYDILYEDDISINNMVVINKIVSILYNHGYRRSTQATVFITALLSTEHKEVNVNNLILVDCDSSSSNLTINCNIHNICNANLVITSNKSLINNINSKQCTTIKKIIDINKINKTDEKVFYFVSFYKNNTYEIITNIIRMYNLNIKIINKTINSAALNKAYSHPIILESNEYVYSKLVKNNKVYKFDNYNNFINLFVDNNNDKLIKSLYDYTYIINTNKYARYYLSTPLTTTLTLDTIKNNFDTTWKNYIMNTNALKEGVDNKELANMYLKLNKPFNDINIINMKICIITSNDNINYQMYIVNLMVKYFYCDVYVINGKSKMNWIYTKINESDISKVINNYDAILYYDVSDNVKNILSKNGIELRFKYEELEHEEDEMLNLKYIDFFNNVHNKNVSYYNNDNLVSGLMDYCIYTFDVRPIETYKKICSFSCNGDRIDGMDNINYNRYCFDTLINKINEYEEIVVLDNDFSIITIIGLLLEKKIYAPFNEFNIEFNEIFKLRTKTNNNIIVIYNDINNISYDIKINKQLIKEYLSDYYLNEELYAVQLFNCITKCLFN